MEAVQMRTKIQKWGNSQGLRFPKHVLEEARITVGDTVQVSVRAGRILIEPAAQVRGRYKLKDLVAKMPKKYKTREEDWGRPVGKEVW